MMPDERRRQVINRLATKVMKWKPGPPDCWETGDKASPTIRMSGWNPLESWTDTGMLVEKLSTLGYHVAPEVDPGNSKPYLYGCTIEARDDDEIDTCEFAPTGPEAITLAVLAAICPPEVKRKVG